MLAVRQRYRRTDGQTDRRTTYDSNTALALRASRGKNWDNFIASHVAALARDWIKKKRPGFIEKKTDGQ